MNDGDQRFINLCLEAGDTPDMVSAYTGFSLHQVRVAHLRFHPLPSPDEVAATLYAPDAPSVAALARQQGCSQNRIFGIMSRRKKVEGDPMKPCFVCDRPSVAEAQGHDICQHHADMCVEELDDSVKARAATIDAEWRRLAATRAWHAGSAYERDQQMAKRLEGVRP
jgi:hypothetical protein